MQHNIVVLFEYFKCFKVTRFCHMTDNDLRRYGTTL